MVLKQRFADREREQQRNSQHMRLVEQLTPLGPGLLLDLLDGLKSDRGQQSRDAGTRTRPPFFEDDPP
jgi:hypothetical protein